MSVSFEDPAYDDFIIEKGEKKGEIDHIIVNIELGLLPDLGSMETIFSIENAWSLFRAEGEYIIRLDRQTLESPYLMARFDFRKGKVTVFCSQAVVSGEGRVLNPMGYPLDRLLVMFLLALRKGAIVHSAGIVYKKKGFIFAGRSGAGKTTISRKLATLTGAEGLSDDRIILRKEGDSFRMFGTPWPGEAGIAVNKSTSLNGIVFLVKSDNNRVVPIGEAEAFRRFMPVLSIPWYDKEAINKIFSFVEELISEVPSYILYFTPDIEVDFLEGFLSGQ